MTTKTVNPVDSLVSSIAEARQFAGVLNRESPSREISLVLTKLDEAQHWFQASDIFTTEYGSMPTGGTG